MRKNGKVTQKDVAAYLGLNQTTISRILAGTPRFTYSEQTRSRVFEAATRLGYLHPAVVKTEKRSSMRQPLPAAAQVRIYLQDGRLFCSYGAQLVNINRTGMLLKDFEGKKRVVPLETFTLEVEFDVQPLGDMKIKARPVRFHQDNGVMGLGVAFLALTEDQTARIDRFLALQVSGPPRTS